MTTYRVGDAGAMVRTASGQDVIRLHPGEVVAGDLVILEDAGAKLAPASKRRRYDDKKIHPAEDKAV